MTALANALENLAVIDTISIFDNHDAKKTWSEAILDDYQDLLELATDLYVASLETNIASWQQSYRH